jgi:hypothetical protein
VRILIADIFVGTGLPAGKNEERCLSVQLGSSCSRSEGPAAVQGSALVFGRRIGERQAQAYAS